MKPDVVIVGAGLTGITIARALADNGVRPLVVERRPVVGGNCRDARHRSGIMYNLHGPHYFRTSSEKIWKFVNRFAHFRQWAAEVMIRTRKADYPWPLVTSEAPAMATSPLNFEEAMLTQVSWQTYKRCIRGYTWKQWGTDPKNLQTSLAGRIEIRKDANDRRLKTVQFQGLPQGGYSYWLMRMLGDVEVVCNVDGRGYAGTAPYMVYTGSIDEFFHYRLGALHYRTQNREHMWRDDVELCINPCVQMNLPDMATRAVRVIEWKHMQPMEKRRPGTLLTWEYPTDSHNEDDREYPFPDAKNQRLYAAYADLAKTTAPNVMFAGRLGKYKYLDMDQAIGAALKTAQALLTEMKIAA